MYEEYIQRSRFQPCIIPLFWLFRCILLLLAVSDYQARYFHAKTKDEENCTNPGVFRRQKDQDTAQYEQRDGQDSFAARILDHGQKKLQE